MICIVWLVDHEDCCLASRHLAHRACQVGTAAQNVVESAEPEARVILFDGNRLIRKHRDSCFLQRVGDVIGIRVDVMVPEHGPHAVRSFQWLENMSTWLGSGGALGRISEPGYRDKVAGQGDQIRMKLVDEADRPSYRV